MGVLQRTIDGVSVWIAPASVTANFGGTHCPRSTIHSSVFGRLWKVTNELRNGLESKTCGPINIRARRFCPFFPPLSLLTPSCFLSLLHPLSGFPCLSYGTSDPEVIKSQDSSLHDITLYPDWFHSTLNTLLFFSQSFMISGYKALPGQSAMLCSLLRVSASH